MGKVPSSKSQEIQNSGVAIVNAPKVVASGWMAILTLFTRTPLKLKNNTAKKIKTMPIPPCCEKAKFSEQTTAKPIIEISIDNFRTPDKLGSANIFCNNESEIAVVQTKMRISSLYSNR